jgi:hypothetical protein
MLLQLNIVLKVLRNIVKAKKKKEEEEENRKKEGKKGQGRRGSGDTDNDDDLFNKIERYDIVIYLENLSLKK